MRPLRLGGALGVLLVLLGAGPAGADPAVKGARGNGPRMQGMRAVGGSKEAPLGKRGAKGPATKAQRTVRNARANMFLRQGSNRAAISSFEKQIEANPDSAMAHVGLAKALAHMGRCSEALDHFWPYVGTVPFGGDAALAASTCSSRMGLLDDAIYFDRIAVDLNPESARAWTNLALDLSSAGDEAGVEETLDTLTNLRPEKDASSYARAVLALRGGDIDTFDRVCFAWEQEVGPSLDLRRLQAQSWLDMDNPVAAVDSLASVKRIRNGQQVRYLRAEAWRRLGYPSEAAANLEDRPQTVLSGLEVDAIRVRVDADSGDFAAAHSRLAEYGEITEPELAASAWYLARAEGRVDDLPGLAAQYERLNTNPLRVLDQLVPWK